MYQGLLLMMSSSPGGNNKSSPWTTIPMLAWISEEIHTFKFLSILKIFLCFLNMKMNLEIFFMVLKY